MSQADPYPITNAVDVAILMHRDIHFGGSFPVMIEYYKNEGVGCSPDFDMNQILALQEMEAKVGENLSAIQLSGADAEKVAKARKAYKQLKELYEQKKPETTIPQLVADLILSEERDPIKEVSAIVAEKRAAIPALLDLIRSEDFHDPMFPGYGRAPELAAQCLGKIGDKSAIAALFEAIRENEFFEEDTSIAALKAIGEPAREFLLSQLQNRPITIDNERAAITLIQFEDEAVAKACFQLLKEINTKEHLPLATYLVLGCSKLESEDLRKEFMTMSERKDLPDMLRQDMKAIRSKW